MNFDLEIYLQGHLAMTKNVTKSGKISPLSRRACLVLCNICILGGLLSASNGWCLQYFIYCKISNKRQAKSQNLNDSSLVLHLSLPNPLKPGVKLRMKM